MRRVVFKPLLMALATTAMLCAGCSPEVTCVVETTVLPDYSVRRVTRMEAKPNPRFPQQRPRMGEYFQYPPAELYDTYVAQQDQALFAGHFDSYEMIPHDLVRITPGTNQLAGNVFSYRVFDLVMFVLADFDETMTDIVQSQADGEAALDELLRLLTPEVMAVLNAKYGAKYDLSRLEAYLYNELPGKLKRLYAGAWAIRRSERSGVTSPGEEFEYYMLLMSEAKREGLELAPPGTPDMNQENTRRLKEYAIQLARQLCPPRQAGTAEAGRELFAGTAMDELLASVQSAIIARHGSLNNFIAKIAALLPRAFGSYLISSVMPVWMLPDATYQFRLRVPGQVIQSNGVREVNGDLIWTYADRDLALTGKSMWARTLFVRETVTYSLGLRGFPASLSDVDRMFGLCLTPEGQPREGLLNALRQAAQARSLAPVEGLAANVSSADAQAARGVLALFENHRRTQAQRETGEGAGQPPPQQAPATVQQGAPATSAPTPVAPMPEPGFAPAPKVGGATGQGPQGSDPLAPMQALPASAPVQPPPLPPAVR